MSRLYMEYEAVAATGNARRAIVIVGMHRSGTSALARVVNILGADLAQNLMRPQLDNPLGFWEPVLISRLNERMLVKAERSWDNPKPIAASWLNPDKRLHDIAEAVELLLKEFPDAELFSLKDPRLSRLLPIWLSAFKRLNIQPSFLIVCRNPLEVAVSLQKRNGIGAAQAQLLWLTYMQEAERETRGYPRAVVHYDQLLGDWRGALAEAYERIGLDSLTLGGELATQVDAFISERHRHQLSSTDALLQHESFSDLVKETYIAFRSRALSKFDGVQRFDRLYAQTMQSWNAFSPGAAGGSSLFQNLSPVSADNTNPQKSSISISQSSSMKETAPRRVILHYHFFKNAGTSVDKILKANFGQTWREKEGFAAGWRANEVADYLLEHPEIAALSSHTALMPVPVLPGVEIFPIIFLRHPIDRVRSIYEFEHTQQADTEGAKMAKRTDVRGYIRWRLKRTGDRAIRNFQCYRLALAFLQQQGEQVSELERAQKALALLPFLGLVERFDDSIQRLEEWLKPYFPDIACKSTKANVTQKEGSVLDERLAVFREELGDELYEELNNANQWDMVLYNALLERYNGSQA